MKHPSSSSPSARPRGSWTYSTTQGIRYNLEELESPTKKTKKSKTEQHQEVLEEEEDYLKNNELINHDDNLAFYDAQTFVQTLLMKNLLPSRRQHDSLLEVLMNTKNRQRAVNIFSILKAISQQTLTQQGSWDELSDNLVDWKFCRKLLIWCREDDPYTYSYSLCLKYLISVWEKSRDAANPLLTYIIMKKQQPEKKLQSLLKEIFETLNITETRLLNPLLKEDALYHCQLKFSLFRLMSLLLSESLEYSRRKYMTSRLLHDFSHWFQSTRPEYQTEVLEYLSFRLKYEVCYDLLLNEFHLCQPNTLSKAFRRREYELLHKCLFISIEEPGSEDNKTTPSRIILYLKLCFHLLVGCTTSLMEQNNNKTDRVPDSTTRIQEQDLKQTIPRNSTITTTFSVRAADRRLFEAPAPIPSSSSPSSSSPITTSAICPSGSPIHGEVRLSMEQQSKQANYHKFLENIEKNINNNDFSASVMQECKYWKDAIKSQLDIFTSVSSPMK